MPPDCLDFPLIPSSPIWSSKQRLGDRDIPRRHRDQHAGTSRVDPDRPARRTLAERGRRGGLNCEQGVRRHHAHQQRLHRSGHLSTRQPAHQPRSSGEGEGRDAADSGTVVGLGHRFDRSARHRGDRRRGPRRGDPDRTPTCIRSAAADSRSALTGHRRPILPVRSKTTIAPATETTIRPWLRIRWRSRRSTSLSLPFLR